MLATRIIIALLSTVALFPPLSVATEANIASNSVLGLLKNMGVSSTARLEVFLDEICRIKPTSVIQVREDFADMRLCRDSIEVKINGTYGFVLDQHSGDLLQYYDSDESSEYSEEDKMRAFRCSPDDVFAMSVKILGLLGQPQDRNQFEVRRAWEDPGGIRNDGFGRWVIERSYSFNNMPCRDRSFSLAVFPEKASVHIKEFEDYRIVPPDEEPQCPISKDEAVSAVKAWFVGASPSYVLSPKVESGVVSKIQKVIALPNRCFVLGKKDPDCRGTKAQYCWEVPFSWMECSDLCNGVLWVSLEKGEVIGVATKH